MNGATVTNVIGTIFGVALVTTLVLPGRQTPQVLTAGTTGTARIINAALGR